ncbi:ABC transporter permease [Roseivirga sp. 4D4]|uniref:ABC transporter permease n=1 Tax=Roseivirga sp. 4D4 TaxID=1889784 RepID=UPI000852D0E8|nr:ABC transporter permease [Roseivirga sp. 4D4]OEK02794.1 ABC transporter permease [Roseivirga sp. 4D4]
MFKSYFKIAWRNIVKKKTYSILNIFGLGLGIACCFLIFMFVQDEKSYDTYHEKGERIYRVTHGYKPPGGNEEDAKANTFWVWANARVGPALLDYFPEIDKIAQFSGRSDLLLRNGDNLYQEEGVFFMDSTVFDVFSWKLLEGDPETALTAPFSIVLTETTAKKYFGDQDAIGKVLKGSASAGRSNAGDYVVTGIMEDIPSNSHFRFNALLSLSTYKKSNPRVFDMWGYADFYTYFLVNKGFNAATFKEKIPAFISKNHPSPESNYTIGIEGLKDVYLRTVAQRQPGETGSLSSIYVFTVIGLFLLAIAMINFMNLSTARAMDRAKEVGIRKSIGADRKNLIIQFLGESFVFVFLSMIIAIILVFIALPFMNDLTNKKFLIQNYLNTQTILLLISVMFIIGIIAGSYPAFILSSFKPVLVLKGILKSNTNGVNLRKILVVFQFSISIALIAGTVTVYSQLNHLLEKDLGFDQERMLVLDYNYDGAVNGKMEVLKTNMEANPAILSTAFSRSVPGSFFPNAVTQIRAADGELKHMGQPIFQVGMDFITHFDLEIIAGRSYSRDFPTDSTSALVLNEAAAKQYGYSNPEDIIGKEFSQWGRTGKVIGVVKDFNYVSLHQGIEPLTLPFSPYASRYLSLKIKSDDLSRTIKEVGEVWTQLAPHRPFVYSFVDDNFNRQYQADFVFRKLFTKFSCLAIFIAFLGLLGLATYTAEQRTKEIGVRKVLGASISNILRLLSIDFIKLIIVAIVVAVPLAYFGMDKWLAGFAVRIELQWYLFALPGVAVLLMALTTVSFQTFKAAKANPVKCLRDE